MLDGVQKGLLGERLGQDLKLTWAVGEIGVAADHKDRQLWLLVSQPVRQLSAGHARHHVVRYQNVVSNTLGK